MKVKNIMFFGFAAAILSAGAASAYEKVPVPTGDALATAKQTVTSKYYVDTAANSLKDDIDNAGSPVKSVTQNGTTVAPDSNGNVAIVAPNWNAASGTAGYIDNKPTFTGTNGQVVTYTATEGTYGAKTLGTAADKDYSTVEITENPATITSLATDTGVATAAQLGAVANYAMNSLQGKDSGAQQNDIAVFNDDHETHSSGKQFTTSVTSSSTDAEVPTAGAVYSAITNATYDDTELAAKVEENKTAISTINASAPMNSGITAAKVSTYDGYADTIASKQTAALEAQGGSETSTVSNSDTNYPSSKNVQSYVAEQIAANNTSTGVANKQDKSGADYQMGNASGGWTTMTPGQQDALNSGATTTNIAQIATNTTAIAGKQATATVDYAVGNTDGSWTSIAKPAECTSTNPCAWVNNAWVPMAI